MSEELSGLDVAATCTSDIVSSLKESGYSFVGRYYSSTTKIAGKKLTQSEAQTICEGGLEIVAVYEDGPTSYSYFSASRGTSDAEAAMAQAEAVGQPKGSAIYFTVDYDATESDIAGNITSYFEALQDAIGDTYAVGVYGSGATCTAMFDAGLAEYAWLAQSTGWSGYSEFTEWSIKQGPEQTVCTLDADTDVAIGDFGSFTV